MTLFDKSIKEPHEWDAAWEALRILDKAIDLARPTPPENLNEQQIDEYMNLIGQFETCFEEVRDEFLDFLIKKRIYENERLGGE